LVRILLAKGADVNAQLKRTMTPRAVLDGADGSMGEGVTPFVRAAHTGDTVIMKMLLDADANPRIATKAGVNALMSAAGVGWRDGKTKGSVEEVLEALKMTIALGLDVNAANDRGETALHGAAQRGAKPIIDFLAANGANFLAKNKAGYTPLDKAMGKGAGLGEVRSPDEAVVALLQKYTEAQEAVAPKTAPAAPVAQN
jgi:ankyrin repeat protein